MAKNKFIKFLLSLIFGFLISYVLSIVISYPLGKILIITGVFYMFWGVFGIFNYMKYYFFGQGEDISFLSKLKNLDMIDLIRGTPRNYGNSSETFSRFFKKSEEPSMLKELSILSIGLILIFSEMFFK